MNNNVKNNEKVILILTDGMHPDVIKHVEKAQMFYDEAASTLKGRAVMPAITLPCHMSLFKGVEPELHECMDNDDPKPYNKIKGICDRLCSFERKSAMFYTWGELRDLTKSGVPAFDCCISGWQLGYEKSMSMVTKAAKQYLTENFTDFAFVHYDLIDSYGHWHGWMSDKYIEATKLVWDEIYSLLEIADENTSVIILSDHSGHDTDHGTEEDTVIPVMIKSKFFNGVKDLGDVSITDIAPTVVKMLGIEPYPYWTGSSLF